MTRKFLWGVIIILLLTNLLTVAVWMKDRSVNNLSFLNVDVKEDEPVATIGNSEISSEQWLADLETNYGKQSLKELINKNIVTKLAKDENLEVNSKIIEREISLLLTMKGVLGKEEIERNIKKWTEDIRYRLYLEELFTRDIEIANSEIEEYYEHYKNQYQFQESIQLSHILVKDKETAEKLIRELENGESFESLAKEYSIDENTRLKGGYLGYFTEDSELLPSEYYSKASDMKELSYSDPFLSANGVAIIYLHQLLPSVTFDFEELKSQIRRDLALDKLKSSVNADQLWDQFEVNWVYD
ncbi:peptidylprolyl isomerase [Aquibacillus kalidii]|uniref:peptidylprolyl isomerase n=1 Tax=Aquibacillus kalidii TaxID=2762597 RepID=UPI0016493CEB|nr:peptidyl-prolyl cis-trans isomerase [Aquibacillus kalidii]